MTLVSNIFHSALRAPRIPICLKYYARDNDIYFFSRWKTERSSPKRNASLLHVYIYTYTTCKYIYIFIKYTEAHTPRMLTKYTFDSPRTPEFVSRRIEIVFFSALRPLTHSLSLSFSRYVLLSLYINIYIYISISLFLYPFIFISIRFALWKNTYTNVISVYNKYAYIKYIRLCKLNLIFLML